MAEIVIGFVQPVLAGRIKNVKINGVFQRPGFVRHVRRDAEHFARPDDDFLAVNGELQGSFEDVGDLLVVMMVERDVSAFFHQHPSKHDFLSMEHFPINQRIEVLAFDLIPGNVFQLAHFISP